MLNRIKGDLSATLHPAKLPTCEKGLRESLSSERTHQQQKADANVTERERTKFQPQQAELSSVSHMVMDLNSRIQEKGCTIFPFVV